MNSVYAVVEVVIAAHPGRTVLEAAHARQPWLALLAVRWAGLDVGAGLFEPASLSVRFTTVPPWKGKAP